ALLAGTVCEPRSKRVRAIRFVLAMGEVAQCGRMAFFLFLVLAGGNGKVGLEANRREGQKGSRVGWRSQKGKNVGKRKNKGADLPFGLLHRRGPPVAGDALHVPKKGGGGRSTAVRWWTIHRIHPWARLGVVERRRNTFQ